MAMFESHINFTDPVKESPTIYDAFIEKEKSSIPVRADAKNQKGDSKEHAGINVC